MDLLKKPLGGILVGAGVALLAPIILPAVARAARPLAKALLHGYFDLAEGLKALAAQGSAEKKHALPVVEHLVTAGVTEAATVAGEEALEDSVADAVVEGVATALEVV